MSTRKSDNPSFAKKECISCGKEFMSKYRNDRKEYQKCCSFNCAQGMRNLKHGMARRGKEVPEWIAWDNIIQRCENIKNPHYNRYGGRGIKICKEWRESFEEFYNHIGPRPSKKHTVDRINNEKGYEPGNVKWSTRKEQIINRSNSVMVTVDGVTKHVTEWAEISGLRYQTLVSRIKAGWDTKRAVSEPCNKKSRKSI